jgi:alpha-tubulin suppressor-like RCC1 family protein
VHQAGSKTAKALPWVFVGALGVVACGNRTELDVWTRVPEAAQLDAERGLVESDASEVPDATVDAAATVLVAMGDAQPVHTLVAVEASVGVDAGEGDGESAGGDAGAGAGTDAGTDGGTDASAGTDAGVDADAASDAATSQAGVESIAVGGGRSCAILSGGRLKCWGYVYGGYLGLGDSNSRGDLPGTMGSHLPVVDLGTGKTATAVTLGFIHTCALLSDSTVKCWGGNVAGNLGQGDTVNRGDSSSQMGDNLPAIDLGTGKVAVAITTGSGSDPMYAHNCALLNDGTVKCWGCNLAGELGLGDTTNRGDKPGEMGDALPAVDLGTGRTALAVSAGYLHTCALLDDHSVKCWGVGGELGLGDGNNRDIGPSQMGDDLPAVDLGTGRTAVAIQDGYGNTCALLDDATVKCWGFNYDGQLGLGDTTFRGDMAGQMGDHLPAVDLGTGRTALAVTVGDGASAGDVDTCAILDDTTLKCWGMGAELGLGGTAPHGEGPGQMGDSLPVVQLF